MPVEPVILACLLLVGTASAAVAAMGAAHDVWSAVRSGSEALAGPFGGPLDARAVAPTPRTCLAGPRCRQAVRIALAASVDSHAAAWWGAFLSAAGAVALAMLMRVRAAAGRPLGRGARFADAGDLRRLRQADGAWFPLGYAPRGRMRRRAYRAARSPGMRRVLAGAPLRLPDEDVSRHVLVVGLTGAGKTTAVTIPVLLDAAAQGVSVVALDLKYGEDDSLARAVPAWQRRGRDVWIFAPLDAGSLRWNPLDGCRTIGAAQRLAGMLLDDVPPGEPDLAYWVGAERQVCAALSLAVSTDGGPPTLERLRAVCEAGPEAVHAYIHAHPASGALGRHLGAYRAMLPKDEAGILQGIASRLEAWTDDAVCRATGVGDPDTRIDLDRLRREPVLLVVGVPQAALGRLRWLCHLFLSDLASRLLRPRGPGEGVRVLQVLEELPAWGRLPGLVDHLATLRSRHVSVLATIQSEAQGEHVYGRAGWAAASANLVTKIYCPPLADLDADRLSRALGTASMHDVSRSRTWGEGGPRGTEHHRDVAVPLCRPEQLQGIDADEDELLVRCARLPPARLWCPPYFARSEYLGLVSARSPTTAEIAVYHQLWMRHERPPLLDRVRPIHTTLPQDAGGLTARRAADAVPPSQAASTTDLGAAPSPPGAGGTSHRVAPARERAEHLRRGAPPGAAAVEGKATPEDLDELRRFVDALVPPASNGAPPGVRVLLRSGHLVELRVDPAVAARLCGGSEALQARARRWAALRWVRRVRPVFVLERRAIEALGESLVRRVEG